MSTKLLFILSAGLLLAGSRAANAQSWPAPGYQTERPNGSASPWMVELVDESGYALSTYRFRGRYYVAGDIGGRYNIRIHNPTDRRVEVVISVDGLDVVDGRAANYKNKRGYLIQPHDDLVVEGWRTSTEEVAAFRFSSVRGSYAGRKGVPRNVGVIGVAFFPEREHAAEIVRPRPRPYYDRDDYHTRSEKAPPAPAESGAPSKSRAPETAGEESIDLNRPGLGTEFGEQQYSAVTYVPFERAHPNRPARVAELRYNDVPGLRALGIRIPPPPRWPEDDNYLRETATPFPEPRFATPP